MMCDTHSAKQCLWILSTRKFQVKKGSNFIYLYHNERIVNGRKFDFDQFYRHQYICQVLKKILHILPQCLYTLISIYLPFSGYFPQKLKSCSDDFNFFYSSSVINFNFSIYVYNLLMIARSKIDEVFPIKELLYENFITYYISLWYDKYLLS